MPLKTIVKVSHISNLSDARYCAGMGVDMLGFRVIAGSEHYMPPERFRDIRGWISGPKIIAELYGLTNAGEIALAIDTYAPDYLEMTFDEFNTFRSVLTLPCMVHLSAASQWTALTEDKKIIHLLVNNDTPCSDMANAGFSILARISTLEDLNDKLSEKCFEGFVLEGHKELRPGVTNYEHLGNILEALEED